MKMKFFAIMLFTLIFSNIAYSKEETTTAVFTKLPLRTTNVTTFKKSQSKIFNSIVNAWDFTEGLLGVVWDHSRSQTPGKLGVGSVRICRFAHGDLYEIINYVDFPNVLAYVVDTKRSTIQLPIKALQMVHLIQRNRDMKSTHIMSSYFNVLDQVPLDGFLIGWIKLMNGSISYASKRIKGTAVLQSYSDKSIR